MERRIDRSSLIALDRFIQATRDSGYKGTISAVSELVDNAIQAKAKSVSIEIVKARDIPEYPIVISVLDDGCGMDRPTLRQALRFGGSSRFNDRSGLGRYGMGLPNASLSQARRIEVFSWRERETPYFSYLDVDEIASGEMTKVPLPSREALPAWVSLSASTSGTLVLWSWCDRLDNRRISTISRKLRAALGRVFRHFLWSGVQVTVNGEQIQPLDPLFLRQPSVTSGGLAFGEPIEYEFRAPASNGETATTGRVAVRFSELPVHEWHDLPNSEKRRLGIANGAGVSVVRAGREVDYGWFFLNGKRRENYDDWWRAEISFDPVLDELFGITHTKQQIRPQASLQEVLGPDMVEMARSLNRRVRDAHQSAKSTIHTRTAELIARRRDVKLRDLPVLRLSSDQRNQIKQLKARHPTLRPLAKGPGTEYRLIQDDLGESTLFEPVIESGRITVVVNPRHLFFRKIYGPLSSGGSVPPNDLLQIIQFLLLSLARAEASLTRSAERRTASKLRKEWSEVLGILLRS